MPLLPNHLTSELRSGVYRDCCIPSGTRVDLDIWRELAPYSLWVEDKFERAGGGKAAAGMEGKQRDRRQAGQKPSPQALL